MKLPKISLPKLSLPKLFSKEEAPKQNSFLLEEYEKGMILQVDNNKDNKEYFEKKRKEK